MWRPSRNQGWVLWALATIFVLLWPMGGGRSLAQKTVSLLADPFHALPTMPPPLPMGLGDDGFAVTQHDQEVAAYREAYRSSWLTRARIRVRDFEMPVDPATQRQLLAAIALVFAFMIWYMEGRSEGPRRTDAGTEA